LCRGVSFFCLHWPQFILYFCPMEKFAKPSRIFEFDIIRVLAMFWVVTYHFGYEYSLGSLVPVVNFFCVTPNFDFGNVAVTMFLVLSGALLYSKYGNETGSLRTFYVKRVKSIYPPFWILNLYIVFTMARHWVSDGRPFFAGNPLKLLFTVIGFDGYLQLFGFETYYFCGEWFVGAIVMLYLAFPLLAWFYRKNRVALLSVLALGYGLQFVLAYSGEWDINPFPVTLMLKFVLGFLLMDLLPRLRGKSVGWISLALFLGLCLFDFPYDLPKKDLLGSVAGIAVFLAVLNFGGRLKDGALGKAVQKLSPVTYCVFLIQHIAIAWLQMGFVKVLGRPVETFSSALSLGILAINLAVIIVGAYLLNFVSGKAVKIVERKFLSCRS